MVPSQRSRLALVVLLAVFLIPVGTSSLRGLTHVLTCTGEAASTFTLIAAEGQEPTMVSSTVVERGAEPLLCGGLALDLAAGSADEGRVAIIVAITNQSDLPWHGTVRLELDGTSIPLAIGRIPPGATVEERVTARLTEGAQDLFGALLLGP